MKRLFTLLVLAMLIMPAAAGLGLAAEEKQSEWQEPGPYPYEQLADSGVMQDEDVPDAVRQFTGPNNYGGARIQTTPVISFQDDPAPSPVKANGLVSKDRLQLFSSAYADAAGEYTVVIVYWDKKTTTVNGTERQYAANQQVQRVNVELEEGYDLSTIQLHSHYDDKVQATMWLERDGERVDGAQWRFEHRSNPLTAAPASPIDSKYDQWAWAGLYVLLPGAIGIFISRRSVAHILDRAIVGPQKGTGFWALVAVGVSLVSVTVGTWQASAVLARLPIASGLFIFVVSFIAFLGFNDPKIELAEFQQKDLRNVSALNDGEETKHAIHETKLLRSIVRRDGNIYMPKPGIRPFIARYWTEPAAVDESELKTVTNAAGDVSKVYEIDPESDTMLDHEPARLVFSPKLFREFEAPEPKGSGIAALPGAILANMKAYGSAINWAFILPAFVGGVGGYLLFQEFVGVKALSFGVATIPVLAAGYTAKGGDLNFDPAPLHFTTGRAILAKDRETYTEARTFEDLHKMVANLDLEVIEQTQNTTAAVRKELQKRLNDMFGVPEGEETIDSGGDDDGNTPDWTPEYLDDEGAAGVSDD